MAAPVTVIIPTFDRPTLAERALRSVQAQTAAPSAIIIADDGHRPTSLATPWYIRTARPDAPYLSWADAVHRAQTPYVMLLADDDWLDPPFLERALALFGDDVPYVFSDATIHFEDGTTRRNLTSNATEDGYVARDEVEQLLLTMRHTISPHCCVFRRDVLLNNIIQGRIPGAPRRSILCGNDALMMLLPWLDRQWTCAGFIPEPLVHFDASPTSVTTRALKSKASAEELEAGYYDARFFYSALRDAIQNRTENNVARAIETRMWKLT